MIPYLTIYCTLLIFSLEKDKVKAKSLFYIATVILFLFAALRGNGDYDYFAYKYLSAHYTNVEQIFSSKYSIEVGYRAISYIVNYFNADSQFVIVLMSLISVGGTFFFIQKMSRVPLFSYVVSFGFYLLLDLQFSRQAMATGVASMSFYFFYKKKYLLCLAFVVIAYNLHQTSLIILLFFIFYKILFEKNGISIKLATFLLLFSNIIVSTIGLDAIILRILEISGLESFEEKFIIYINSEQFGYPFSLLDPRLLFGIATYFIIKINLKYIIDPEKRKEIVFLSDVLLVSNLMMILFSEHTLMATRISYYFSALNIVTVPNFCYYLSEERLLKKTGQVPWFAYSDWLLMGGYIVLNFAFIINHSTTGAYILYRWN